MEIVGMLDLRSTMKGYNFMHVYCSCAVFCALVCFQPIATAEEQVDGDSVEQFIGDYLQMLKSRERPSGSRGHKQMIEVLNQLETDPAGALRRFNDGSPMLVLRYYVLPEEYPYIPSNENLDNPPFYQWQLFQNDYVSFPRKAKQLRIDWIVYWLGASDSVKLRTLGVLRKMFIDLGSTEYLMGSDEFGVVNSLMVALMELSLSPELSDEQRRSVGEVFAFFRQAISTHRERGSLSVNLTNCASGLVELLRPFGIDSPYSSESLGQVGKLSSPEVDELYGQLQQFASDCPLFLFFKTGDFYMQPASRGFSRSAAVVAFLEKLSE